MSHVKRKGPWVEEKSVGSGGFGEVTLWTNQVTNWSLVFLMCSEAG